MTIEVIEVIVDEPPQIIEVNVSEIQTVEVTVEGDIQLIETESQAPVQAVEVLTPQDVEVIEVVYKGAKGDTGIGVPVGGTTGQVLAKASGTNYDTEWVNQSGGGAISSVFGRTGAVIAQAGDYTTAIVADSLDKRYVTDAQLVVIGNTSGTNTGDVTVTDSSEIDFTLTGQNITASIIAGSIDETKLDTSVNASLDLADSAVQPAALAPYVPYTGATDDVDLGVNEFSNGENETYSLEFNLEDVLGTRELDPSGAFTGDGNYTYVVLLGYKDIAGTRIYTYENYIELYNEEDEETFNILWSFTPNEDCDGYIFVDPDTYEYMVDVGDVSEWLQDFPVSDWSTKTPIDPNTLSVNTLTTAQINLSLEGVKINDEVYISANGLRMPNATDRAIPYVDYTTKQLATDENFRYDGTLYINSGLNFTSTYQYIGGNYSDYGGSMNITATYPNAENAAGSAINFNATSATAKTSSVGTAQAGGAFVYNAGIGGASSYVGSGTNTGGNAGNFTFNGATGGTASGGTSNGGGTGSNYTINLGAGGASQGGTGNGGNAGNFTVQGRAGGAKTLAHGNGGAGSSHTLAAGQGGSSTYVGGGTNQGGTGGALTLQSGTGGTASGSTTGTGGQGGTVNVTSGSGGAGVTTGGQGGSYTLQAGGGGSASAGTGGAAGAFQLLGSSGGAGRTGGGGTAMTYTSGNGGAATTAAAFANLGGNGGQLSFTSGAGGAAGNSTISNQAGSGGSFSMTSGQGGNVTNNAALTNHAGPAGQFTITGGVGGVASGTSGAANFSSTGGNVIQIGGAGGAATSIGALENRGGVGGGLVYTAGAGGAASGATSSNRAGAGGSLTITGGAAGTASGTGAVGARGGSASIVGGSSSLNNDGGDAFVCGGLGNGTGRAGNVFLALETGGSSRGSVGIGSDVGALNAKLEILSTTEQLRVRYDALNYYSTTVSSTGGVTFDAVGSGARFIFADRINIPTSTPASASATGTTGDIAWDANYIYVCTATNTWKRTAIATW